MKSVTVVTVVYNNLVGLKATYASFREQDFSRKEMIIVDGNSSDCTRRFLESLSEESDVEWLIEPDEGLYDAMNKGLRMAKGDYIIFMNGGDTFYNKEVLEKSMNELKRYNFPDLLYCSAHFCFPSGKHRLRASRKPSAIWHGQPALHQSTFFKTQEHIHYEYDTSFVVSADYDLICRLRQAGKIAKSSSLLVSRFNTDVNSISARNRFKLIREVARSQYVVLRLNLPLVLYSMARRILAMSIISIRRYLP